MVFCFFKRQRWIEGCLEREKLKWGWVALLALLPGIKFTPHREQCVREWRRTKKDVCVFTVCIYLYERERGERIPQRNSGKEMTLKLILAR